MDLFTFSILPKFIQELIFSFISSRKDLLHCCLLEKKIYSIIKNSKIIWKNLFYNIAKEELLLKENESFDDLYFLKDITQEIDFKKLIFFLGFKKIFFFLIFFFFKLFTFKKMTLSLEKIRKIFQS